MKGFLFPVVRDNSDRIVDKFAERLETVKGALGLLPAPPVSPADLAVLDRLVFDTLHNVRRSPVPQRRRDDLLPAPYDRVRDERVVVSGEVRDELVRVLESVGPTGREWLPAQNLLHIFRPPVVA